MKQAGVNITSCAGIAIGFPGIIDVRTGRILSTLKKYEDVKHFDLNHWCREMFSVRLRIDNDARIALLGEQFSGTAKGVQDVVMITLGTGLGGAAMIMERLLRGVHSQAGYLGGHLPVDFCGPTCSCGNIGCAEAEAAGWSLPNIIRGTAGFDKSTLCTASTLDFETLFTEAERGDEVALRVRKHCLDVWAANAVALIHAYDPSVVLFGGGVMQSRDIILPHVQNHMQKHAWTAWGTPQVRAAKLGANAALYGGVPLFLEEL